MLSPRAKLPSADFLQSLWTLPANFWEHELRVEPSGHAPVKFHWASPCEIRSQKDREILHLAWQWHGNGMATRGI